VAARASFIYTAATADLQGLEFLAGLGTTDFKIHVTDTAGATATDDATSIVGISINAAHPMIGNSFEVLFRHLSLRS